MLRVVTFLAGCAAIATGLGWWVAWPVGLVVAGVELCGVAYLAERDAAVREAREAGLTVQQRDELRQRRARGGRRRFGRAAA